MLRLGRVNGCERELTGLVVLGKVLVVVVVPVQRGLRLPDFDLLLQHLASLLVLLKPARISGSFNAEISVRSPKKSIYFHNINDIHFLDKSVQKMFYFISKTKALAVSMYLQPKYRSDHPKNYLFSLFKIIIIQT